MFKHAKKSALAIVLIVMMVLSTGCSNLVRFDSNKTQLFVRLWDNGFGVEYANLIKERFETAYKDEVFEDGKTGVEVVLNIALDDMSTIGSATEEVFFGQGGAYFDLASQGLLLDVSDVAEWELPGEDGATIISKMNANHRTAFTALDGKYYGFPYLQNFTGLIYDVDYFEDKMLFFDDNGNFVTTRDKAARSVGNDGIKGTGDDGLPVTYIEFFRLCDAILGRGGIPILWTGQYKTYMYRFLRTIAAAYEGYESYAAKYNFDGEVEIVTGWKNETLKIAENYSLKVPVTETVKITPSNGYLLKQAAGKYYALAFVEALLSNNEYYHNKSFSEIKSHLDAQEDFIMSKWDNDRIAMLIDGNYWEGEAGPAFNRSYSKGASAYNRNFGLMPLPSYVSSAPAADQRKKQAVPTELHFMLINANIAKGDNAYKIPLAKKFLHFCFSDASLRDIVQATGSPSPLTSNYMSDEVKGGLSRFKRDVWEYFTLSDTVSPISASKFFIDNQTDFAQDQFTSLPHTYPHIAYKNSGVTAVAYFEGMAISERSWKDGYGV